MVTERARTLPTEPTEGEIAKSNPLLSFINIGQRGRMWYELILGWVQNWWLVNMKFNNCRRLGKFYSLKTEPHIHCYLTMNWWIAFHYSCWCQAWTVKIEMGLHFCTPASFWKMAGGIVFGSIPVSIGVVPYISVSFEASFSSLTCAIHIKNKILKMVLVYLYIQNC